MIQIFIVYESDHFSKAALWLAENHREMGQDAVFLKM